MSIFRKREANRKKYGLIRRKDEKCGLGSYMMTAMGGIYYCLEHGLIPIVDLSTSNMYLEKQSDNAWEYYFRQPCGVSISDIEDMNEVEMVEPTELAFRPKMTMDFLTNSDVIKFWNKVAREYLKLSEESTKIASAFIEEYIPNNTRDNTIGILARGTDYLNLKPYGHPVQPSTDQLIADIKAMMKQTGCTRLYLATEDKNVYAELKKEFGDIILAPNVNRYVLEDREYLADALAGRSNKKMGYEYLASLIVLSKCRCIIAGRTSGSVVAKIMHGNYDAELFYNKGLYGIDDYETLVNK